MGIKMQQITKIIHTETGHRLTNYKGLCAHLHGHSYKWEVTVEGDNLDNGMVMDFKDLKKILNVTVNKLDHSFVMHREDPLLKVVSENDIYTLFTATDGNFPRLYIVPFNPTVENLVRWQRDEIEKLMPPNIRLHSIKCWETENSFCRIEGSK